MENKINNYINIDIPERENEYASNVNTIECVICLENILDDDPMLILDCCRKKVHLKCIIDWYSKYPNNKTCFICSQSNNFCKDLVYSDISNSNTDIPTTIRINTQNIESSSIFDRANCIILCPFVFILLFIFLSIYYSFEKFLVLYQT